MSDFNCYNYQGPTKGTGDDGNGFIHQDSVDVTTALTVGNKISLCVVPGGTKVHRVTISNPDLDSSGTPALAVNIGFENVDGSAGPSATELAAAVATWQGAATTAYDKLPPVILTKDAYLVATVTTAAATPAAGTISSKVESEGVGIK